jgi:hypothetical protein
MAQLLQVEWLQTIKGDKYEQINAMAVAPSGDVYVVGFYQGNFSDLIATAEEDAFVAKYNEEGQLLWLRNLSSSSVDRFNGIAIANDQEIYLTGEFKGSIYNYSDSISSQNQLDMLLVKIDSSGTIQWLNSGSGLGYESGHSISIAPNGSLMITGYFEQDFRIDSLVLTSNGLRDVFVASIDPITGQAQWLSSFGGLAIEQTQSIKADAANNTYVTGSFRDALFIGADTIFSKGSYDVFLAKYDGSGQLSWIKTFGGFGVDEGTYVNVDAAQNIYVSGWFNRSMFIDSMFLIGGQEDNAMLVKFNPAGDLLWVNDIGQNFDERAYAIDFDNQNNVYVLGTLDSFMILGQDTFTNRHVNRSTDIFLAKYNQEGDLFWARDMGYHFNDFCFDLYVQNQQNIYIVGSFQDSTIFLTDSLFSEGESYDIFVAKFGVDTTLTLDEKQGPLLNALQSNPNPSFGPWSLQYYLEKEALVEIRLTDYIGRTNNLLFKSFQQKGAQRLYFPRKQLYEGVYLIRLIVNQQSYTIKHVFR